MLLNNSAAAKLLDPVSPGLRNAIAEIFSEYPEECSAKAGWSFRVFCFSDGVVSYSEPEADSDAFTATTIEVIIVSKARAECTLETHDPFKDFVTRFTFYTADLIAAPSRYTVYHLGFQCEEEDPSFDQFAAGYIGITKRSPLTRYKEHKAKVEASTGSILHRAWRGLVDGGVRHIPAFKIYSTSCANLAEAYAEEEQMVAAHTLNPKGLNAIPGGMAGIRMMHELRLLSSTSQVSVEDRERAIERLCNRADRRSAKAHFRTGHVRRLQSGTKTWVRSCWVNLAPGEATAV